MSISGGCARSNGTGFRRCFQGLERARGGVSWCKKRMRGLMGDDLEKWLCLGENGEFGGCEIVNDIYCLTISLLGVIGLRSKFCVLERISLSLVLWNRINRASSSAACEASFSFFPFLSFSFLLLFPFSLSSNLPPPSPRPQLIFFIPIISIFDG